MGIEVVLATVDKKARDFAKIDSEIIQNSFGDAFFKALNDGIGSALQDATKIYHSIDSDVYTLKCDIDIPLHEMRRDYVLKLFDDFDKTHAQIANMLKLPSNIQACIINFGGFWNVYRGIHVEDYVGLSTMIIFPIFWCFVPNYIKDIMNTKKQLKNEIIPTTVTLKFIRNSSNAVPNVAVGIPFNQE